MSEQDEVQRRIASIESLVREAERVSDPASRSLCRQLVQSLMDLHGAGLGRMLEIVHQTGEPGQQIIDEMGIDPLVRSLLLLYGLHPLGVETRVLQALEKVRPYLRSHGSEIELIGLTDAGALTLRVEGSSHSCPSSAATLQSTVEQAVYDAAPDVASIVVEGVAEESSPGAFVPLEVQMCAAELAPEHQHLIEIEKRKLMCACDACALLFTTQAGTKLRRVPRRVRFLPRFRMSDAQWNGLMIPIEMAFLFYSSLQGRVVACYPSPAGATESLLSLDTWTDVLRENPALAEITPDVEALLVNRVGAARDAAGEYFIAPVDECYKLVGLIRLHWHGLSGGTEMWREIASFFAALKAKAEIPDACTDA